MGTMSGFCATASEAVQTTKTRTRCGTRLITDPPHRLPHSTPANRHRARLASPDYTAHASCMPVSARLRHRFVDLRTEGGGTIRETAAVALGMFVGCLPVYGFHLVIVLALGYAFRLNRLKMY